jgi:hypothetical protein
MIIFITTYFNYNNILAHAIFLMVEILSLQPMFIIHVKYFFVVYAVPSDDGR